MSQDKNDTTESGAREGLLSALSALGLAIDMANGSPETTALRGTWVAVVAAEELGLSSQERAEAVLGALFRYLGCTSYAHEEARSLGDEHVAARALAPLDKLDRGPIAKAVLQDLPGDAFERAMRAAKLMAEGAAFTAGYERSHCEGAMLLASRLGAGPGVLSVLAALHERWDGEGGPAKLSGSAIPVAARVVHLAREATVHFLLRGEEPGVVRCLERRAKGQLDPEMCRALASSPRFLGAFREGPLWENVQGAIDRALDAGCERVPTKDDVIEVMGDFADQKCPIFLGHSRRVAALAQGAALRLRLDPLRSRCLVRAAWLHDVGRVGVPNRVLGTRGPLGPIEWEKVRLHPYVGERIAQHLDPGVARIVGAHHERLDGSGYPKGERPDLMASVLAAADVLAASGEDRPHRPRFDAAARHALLTEEARAGRLPQEAVEAVLAADGADVDVPRPSRSPELSSREREVISLVARGLSNKEIAQALGISARTVQSHTIHAYDKLEVRTRAGAALRASELGLLAAR